VSRLSPAWLGDPGLALLAGALAPARGRIFLVGGAVRDAVLGIAEPAGFSAVCGLAAETGRDRLDAAGLAYAPHPFRPDAVLVSLPEGAVSGVALDFTGEVPLAQAARARDFTCNAIHLGLDGVVHDPLGGLADIAARRLRPAAPDAFAVDPVRVLRLPRMLRRIGPGAAPAPGTEALARAAAPGLAAADPARVAVELARMLDLTAADEAAADVMILDRLGALRAVYPKSDPAGFAVYCRACVAAGADEGEEATPRMAVLGHRPHIGYDARAAAFGDARDARIAECAALLLGAATGGSVLDAVLSSHGRANRVGGGSGMPGRA